MAHCKGSRKPWEVTSYRPQVLKGQTILAGPSSGGEGQGLRHIHFTAIVDAQFSSRAGDLYKILDNKGYLRDLVDHERRTFALHMHSEVLKFGVDHVMWITELVDGKERNIELKWCLDQTQVSTSFLSKSSLKWPRSGQRAARAILLYMP